MEMKIDPLKVQEIKRAKLMSINSSQREVFLADICNLTDRKPVGMKRRLKTLTSFLLMKITLSELAGERLCGSRL